MNLKIIAGAIAGVVVIGGGVILMTRGGDVGIGGRITSACAGVCQHAGTTCPSLINEADCNSRCANLSEETRKHLQEANTCEQITSKPDLLAELLTPEVATPKPIDKNADKCESACGNYVGKCLTLVPNATPALFEEGQTFCESECAGWVDDKVDCIVNAFDCEAMTNVCGL